MFSVHRRYERYSILYTYKIIENIAPNLTANPIQTQYSERRGRLCKVPTLPNQQCPSLVKNLREASLCVRGPKLFNCLPKTLRNVTGVSVDCFKKKLDQYLTQLPDQPTVDGYYGLRSFQSNSLLDIIPQMNRAAAEVPQINTVNTVEEAQL